MNWINKVFLLAGGLALAVTLLSYAFGFGWLSLIAAMPTFMAVSVLVPFFLGLRDRRLAIEKRRRQGRRKRGGRKRMTGPVPAAPNRGAGAFGGARREGSSDPPCRPALGARGIRAAFKQRWKNHEPSQMRKVRRQDLLVASRTSSNDGAPS